MHFEQVIFPRKVALILGTISAYLAIQSLIVEYLIENVLDSQAHSSFIVVIDLFSVNAEQTIPTWYAALMLFLVAVLLAGITLVKQVRQEPYARHWAGLAIIFVYLSMDEGAVIHEIVADALQTSLNLTGYLAFGWQIVAVPLLVLFGVLYLRFLLHLPRQTRNLFILAGAVYVGGALVVEGVSANQWYVDGGITFPYLAIATVEELCEMLGVVVFIYALLAYIVQMQYAFLFLPSMPQEISRQTLSDPSVTSRFPSASVRHLLRSSWQFRMAAGVIGLIVVSNLVLVSWALGQPRPKPQPLNDIAATPSLIDQLAVQGVVVTHMEGRFSPDNRTSRQVTAALLATFEEVMVVTLPNTGYSIVLASDELPFNQDNLTEMLRANGEMQFIIFDTSAVKAITGQIQ